MAAQVCVVRGVSPSARLPAFAQKNDSAHHPALPVHPSSSGAANKDVHQVRQIVADASAVPVVGHQFSDQNPERFPALGHGFRPSAWAAKESVGAVKYLAPCSVPLQPDAHLEVALQPVDDLRAQFRPAAAELSVALPARQSSEVPPEAAAQQELSLEMLAQWKPQDAVVHLA